MRGTLMYGPGDVRVEDVPEPSIVEPTDAIIRIVRACVCGSDLWPYRGIGVDGTEWPTPMGHEYVGIVEELGRDVKTIEAGQFVVGSFWASDNTCETCRAGYQSACVNRIPMGALGSQAELLRVPLADGTLVATPGVPDDEMVPSLLAASDVLGTGWFAAVAAEAGPGKTVAVVGDGAVGLLGVLAAKQLGAAGDIESRVAGIRDAWEAGLGRSTPTAQQTLSAVSCMRCRATSCSGSAAIRSGRPLLSRMRFRCVAASNERLRPKSPRRT